MQRRRFVQVEIGEGLIQFIEAHSISARGLIYRLMALCEGSVEVQKQVMLVAPGEIVSPEPRTRKRREALTTQDDSVIKQFRRHHRETSLAQWTATTEGRRWLRSEAGQAWLADTHTRAGEPVAAETVRVPLTWVDAWDDPDEAHDLEL